MASRERSRTLQQAASTIFVLMAILPLLIFTWTLYRLQALERSEAQIGLALALILALTGFFVFRNLMAHLSDTMQALASAIDQQQRLRAPAPGAGRSIAGTSHAGPAAGPTAAAVSGPTAAPASIPAPGRPAPPPTPPSPFNAPPPPSAPPAPRPTAAPVQRSTVAGIGSIAEFGDMTAAMSAMWAREAVPFIGASVRVSLVRAAEPLQGTLKEVTADGLILETPRGETAISFQRISNIERG